MQIVIHPIMAFGIQVWLSQQVAEIYIMDRLAMIVTQLAIFTWL